MEIVFGSKKLRRQCTGRHESVKAFGKQRAKILGRRLDQLRAAETLAVMRRLPGRCHELTGDRGGTLSIDLDGPYRLLFVPVSGAGAMKPDGGLDWDQVRSIRILGVEDTHG